MLSQTYFFALAEDCLNFFLYSPMWYFSAIMFACCIVALVRRIFHIFS